MRPLGGLLLEGRRQSGAEVRVVLLLRLRHWRRLHNAAAAWPASWIWRPPWCRAALSTGAIRWLLPASSSLVLGAKALFRAMAADALRELDWEWGSGLDMDSPLPVDI
jgi:hypothetical protein